MWWRVSVRTATATLLVCTATSLLPEIAEGQRLARREARRPAAAAAAPAAALEQNLGTVAVSFVPLAGSVVRELAPGQSSLDLGAVSASGLDRPGLSMRRTSTGFVVSARVGIRIAGEGDGQAVGVSAFLLHPHPVFRISLDGVRLGPSPQLIRASLQRGAVSEHRLEIEVPESATEATSNLATAIGLLVVSN